MQLLGQLKSVKTWIGTLKICSNGWKTPLAGNRPLYPGSKRPVPRLCSMKAIGGDVNMTENNILIRKFIHWI